MTIGTGTAGATAGEPAAGAGANPAGAAVQPGTPQPQGTNDATELDRLRRIEQQYRGAAPMLEAMVKAGIKTADDLNRVHGIASRVGELGVDLDQLTASFQGRTRQTPAAGDDGGDDEGVDIEAVVDRRLATRDHATAEAVEKRLIASTINTLAGEGASDRTKKAIAGIVGELVNDRSTLYPKGHPLAGQLRPLGDNEMAEIRAEAETIWKEARGVPLSSVAAGAATARPVAGSAAGQGPAADKQNTTHLPAYKRPMEDRRAQVRQIVQGLGTGGSAPMSRA